MTLKDAAELALVLARNAKEPAPPLHCVAQDVARLRRCGRRALTRGVNWCNVPGYDAEKSKESILRGVQDAIEAYRVTKIDIGGDPRGGSCLTLHFADGATNRFDREGWSI